MLFQPLRAWRHIKVTSTRKKTDSAFCLRDLVDLHFPYALAIHVVLYETFDPCEARRIAQKLIYHYTPKHGSWLNMVEIELSILSRQCLQQRIPDQFVLQHQVKAWAQQCNLQYATVHWRFSVSDVRITLASLCPS